MITNICYKLTDGPTLLEMMHYRRHFQNGIGFIQLFKQGALEVRFMCEAHFIGIIFSRVTGNDDDRINSPRNIYIQRYLNDSGFLTEEEIRGIFCKIKRILNMLNKEKEIMLAYGYEEFSPFNFKRISREIPKDPMLISPSSLKKNKEIHFKAKRKVAGTCLSSFENQFEVSVGWPKTLPNEFYTCAKGTLPMVVTDVEKRFLSSTLGTRIDVDYHIANTPSPLRDAIFQSDHQLLMLLTNSSVYRMPLDHSR